MNVRGQYIGTQNKDNIIVQPKVTDWWSRWTVRYVKDEQTYQTGEFHPTYGVTCNKKFHIISQQGGKYL
jgi:hypothetical protein